jgi:putative acetyltransferase
VNLNSKMRTIRKTIKADLEEVFNLIYVSFSNMAESDLVKQLISDEDVLINLVIETSDIIVGNIVVSKLTMEPDVGLFCGGVAPLSVLPEHQSSGVGTQLMHEAIKKSQEMKIDALFLLGNPNYYKKFNFIISDLESDYSAEHFQQLELTKGCLINLKSKITYANAFLSL